MSGTAPAAPMNVLSLIQQAQSSSKLEDPSGAVGNEAGAAVEAPEKVREPQGETKAARELAKQMQDLLKAVPKPPTPETAGATSSSLCVSWSKPSYTLLTTSFQALTQARIPHEAVVHMQYQLRYFKTGHTLTSSWKHVECKELDSQSMTVSKLKSKTGYTMTVRARGVVTLENMDPAQDFSDKTFIATGPWGSWSDRGENLLTMTVEEEEREVLTGRLRDFLAGELSPYTPELIADTLFAKAERVGGAALSAATVVLPGAYKNAAKIAKLAWSVRRMGLSALIFAEDLQRVAAVLATLAGSVRDHTGLSTKDMTVGAYYLLWIRRADRVSNPEAERLEHMDGVPGVLQQRAPDALLRELSWYMPICFEAYGESPLSVQWLINKYPTRHDGFTLIGSSPYASKVSNCTGVYKPAYFLAAHERNRLAFFSIRGTKQVEDVLADANAKLSTPVDFGNVRGHCHGGMLASALWLGENAGVFEWLEELHDAGYRIVLSGHSLGGGVAVLLGCMLKQRYPKISVTVYGYATPSCVDENIAEACKGDFITVRSLINRDDIVPRLSVANTLALAKEIKARREEWAPLLSSDVNGFLRRAQTLWAPHQRASKRPRRSSETGMLKNGEQEVRLLKDGDAGSSSEMTTTRAAELQEQQGAKSAPEPISELNIPLVVPGLICHMYKWRGQSHCTLVDHRFPGLRRIEAYHNCFDDHTRSIMQHALRDVFAACSPDCEDPPAWEPVNMHREVLCSVCGFDVSWSHTGDADTQTARAAHHCRACGSVVCKPCAQLKVSLPQHGMLFPQRVCDICFRRISAPPTHIAGGKTESDAAPPMPWDPCN